MKAGGCGACYPPAVSPSSMRIWDVEPRVLCRQHLLGEHRELHGLWNILTLGKKGYSLHPETLRWRGKLAALAARHEALVAEMSARGYRHATPLPPAEDPGRAAQDVFVDSPEQQRVLLSGKPCPCPLITHQTGSGAS